MMMEEYAQRSPLQKVNTAAKSFAAVSSLIICLVVGKLAFSLILFAVMALATILLVKIPVFRYIKLCMIPAAFLLLAVITIAIGYANEPVGLVNLPWFGGYLLVSADGLWMAVTLFFQSMAAISCLYFFCCSTPVNQMMGLMYDLHLPKLFVELCLLIYRFIFLLLEKNRQIAIAQKSRLGNKGFAVTLRSAATGASSVFIGAFRKSDAIFSAMESRGYDGVIPYVGDPVKLTRAQWCVFLSYEFILFGTAAWFILC